MRLICTIPNLLDFSQKVDKCFVRPIFLSYGFWHLGHSSCVIIYPVFFSLAHLALQNVNKDYVIFLYFRNFVAKSDQKAKTKNGMNETKHAGKENLEKNVGKIKKLKAFAYDASLKIKILTVMIPIVNPFKAIAH